MLTVQLPPNHAGPTVEVEGPDGRKHTLVVPEHTQGQFQAQVDVIAEMGGQLAMTLGGAPATPQQPPSVVDEHGRYDRAVYSMVAVPKHPTAPIGLGAGQVMDYRTPDGGRHRVLLPPNVQPGQRFEVILPIAVPKVYLREHCRDRREAPAAAKNYWRSQRAAGGAQPQPQRPVAAAAMPLAPAAVASAPPVQQVQQRLPDGWERRVTDDGRPYYAHHKTRTTQWEPPT